MDPLFRLLMAQASGLFGEAVKWNFTKFLVNVRGRVRHRFVPLIASSKIVPALERLLEELKTRAQGPMQSVLPD